MNLDPTVRDWESDLYFTVMEDYLYEARMTHLAKNPKEHMERMRGHFKELADYIDKRTDAAKAEGYEKAIAQIKAAVIKRAGVKNNLMDMEEGSVKALYLSSVLEILSDARSLTDGV